MGELLTELVLGFQFWTLFQALTPMIWFYPLNELDISGYEAFAAVLYSPILLGTPYFGCVLRHKWTIMFLRLCSLFGLLSFQAPTTMHRLFMLSFGCFASMIVLTVTLSDKSPNKRNLTICGLSLGLLLFISSRIWFTSFVPTWWNTTTNSIVTSICLVATINKIVEEYKVVTDPISSSSREATDHWLRMGLGLGSLIYVLQFIFGEVSVITRWSVIGYPETGPKPFWSGLIVLTSLILGAYLSSYKKLCLSYLWWIGGCSSLASVYFFQAWTTFFAGVILAMFVTSIFPTVLMSASKCSPCKLMFVSITTWLFEMLFSVWTVAYNFVPGGLYTRERTDLLIYFIILNLIIALTSIKQSAKVSDSKNTSVGYKPSPNSNFFLLMMLLFGVGGFASRYTKQEFVNEMKPPKVFTAAIWTFHFGYDNEGWPSLSRASSLLKETQADIITLLESDASKPFLGNNDLAMWLSEELSMFVDFGPSTKDHTWGNLLLSKYPIIKSKHHLLPSPLGELAPAITATVNMEGDLVDFVVTHMGNDRDELDRDLQAKFLANELKNSKHPVVFLGYITSAPSSRDYKELIEHGRVRDIDPTDKERWCEYIMYRDLIRLGYARISHGGLSDTEIQMAKFKIPLDHSNFSDNEIITINPKRVDESIRFSPKFGKYKIGHSSGSSNRFHMNTPKYFIK